MKFHAATTKASKDRLPPQFFTKQVETHALFNLRSKQDVLIITSLMKSSTLFNFNYKQNSWFIST